MNGGGGLSTRCAATVLALGLALSSVGVATAAAPGKVIGHAVRLKGTKIFYASGKAVLPRTVSASVVATPEQPVKVQWSLVCQKPNHGDPAIQIQATGTSGQTSVHAAATVKLALPYAKPPTCIATVYATLARNGRLVLRLLQT